MTAAMPETPSKDSIWQQHKQQLISRLAAKGIHISEDDPRLNLPPEDDYYHCNETPPEASAARFSEEEPPRQTSGISMNDRKPDSRFNDVDKAPPPVEEPLQFGKDPVSEASRRRQMKEATRQLLEQQILEKQKNIDQERLQRGRSPRTGDGNRSENGSNPLSPSVTSSILPSSDPLVEKQRRRQMQLEMNNILQQQMREKSIKERMAQMSIAQDTSASTASPLTPCRTPQRLRSPEPGTSITALNRDPQQEVHRRRKSQIDLDSFLKQQIQERQRTKSSGRLLSQDADYQSPFADRRSPLTSRSSDASYSNAIPIGEKMETPEAVRQKQREYGEALKLQMRERSRSSLRRSFSTQLDDRPSGSLFPSAIPLGEKAETPEIVRQRQQELAQALRRQMQERRKSAMGDRELRNSASPSVHQSSESPFRSALSFGEKVQTPELIRQKKRDYAEALQRQMQGRLSADRLSDRSERSRPAPKRSVSPDRVALPIGEKVETPEIARQRQREYAEVLHRQMLERQQRSLQEKAKWEEEDRRHEENRCDWSQGDPGRTSPLSRSGSRRRSPSKVSDGLRPSNLFASAPEQSPENTGARMMADIFNHDPVKAAIAQKVQRRQLGEELQKQMEEQKQREELRKLKEQQENLEDDHRLLRQIEEMNTHVRNEVCKSGQDVERNHNDRDDRTEHSNDDRNEKRNHGSSKEKSPTRDYSTEIPRESSPLRPNLESHENVDWKQTEAEFIRPLRQIRDKLALDSGELRQSIAEQRQKIHRTIVERESNEEDLSHSLPNVSSWVPVESDSDHQLPVRSEFVDLPASASDRFQGLHYQSLSDDDILERFVNESSLPSPAPSNQLKKRSTWGAPVVPVAIQAREGRPLTPSETILRSRAGFSGSNFSPGSD